MFSRANNNRQIEKQYQHQHQQQQQHEEGFSEHPQMLTRVDYDRALLTKIERIKQDEKMF